MRELSATLPNSDVRSRKNVGIKKIIPVAVAHGYTDIIIVNQDRRLPSILQPVVCSIRVFSVVTTHCAIQMYTLVETFPH